MNSCLQTPPTDVGTLLFTLLDRSDTLQIRVVCSTNTLQNSLDITADSVANELHP
jgi:hypothetical protein